MSFDRDAQQWNCVKGGVVNFQKVSAIVRDMGEPCLQQTPIKVAINVRLSKTFLDVMKFSIFSCF